MRLTFLGIDDNKCLWATSLTVEIEDVFSYDITCRLVIRVKLLWMQYRYLGYTILRLMSVDVLFPL